MPLTDAEFRAWQLDSTRNPFRIFLFEADYAIENSGDGHGRSNDNASLLDITSLTLRTYNPTFAEVTFQQPVQDEGYEFEIWVDGRLEHTTKGGSYNFTTSSSGTTVVAVNARLASSGAYSIPWIASIQNGRTGTHTESGSAGNWANVGPGTGSAAVNTVRLASKPWMSDTHKAFDDWLITDPRIEDNLGDFDGIGDVEAVNQDSTLNWQKLNFRGYESRWSYGDVTWPYDDFRRTATTLTSDCRRIESKRFKFDLMDAGQELNRTFRATETTSTISTKSTIRDVLSDAGLDPVTFINVPNATRDYQVDYTLTTELTVIEALQTLAAGINAYVRVNQLGGVEVFIPDPSAPVSATLTEDDILDNGLRIVEVTPAYKRVTFRMSNGNERTAQTTALTGQINEELRIDTVLRVNNEADIVLAEKVAYHARAHPVWELQVLGVADTIQVGDYIAVDHRELQGAGLVKYIRRSPLSAYTIVEVEL